MWGIWATDPRGVDPEGEPFEIPMQGMGVFSCRKEAWLGFNPAFRGFGGEEGYIHEKFRQARSAAACACPGCAGGIASAGPSGVPYRLTVEDKLATTSSAIWSWGSTSPGAGALRRVLASRQD